MTVSNGTTTYASELFGEGHSSPVYPTGATPKVVITIPQAQAARAAAGANTDATDDDRDACAAQDYRGEADITFTLTGGAVFDANISSLMFDPNTSGDNDVAANTATGDAVAIKDGGRKGDNFITLTIQAATASEVDKQQHRTRQQNPYRHCRLDGRQGLHGRFGSWRWQTDFLRSAASAEPWRIGGCATPWMPTRRTTS